MAKELKLLGTTWACYFRASLCVTSSLPRVSHTHIDHPQQAQAGNHHAQLKKLPHWYFSCCHFSLHTTTESHHANTHPDREREREGGWMAEKLSDANHWSEHTHTHTVTQRESGTSLPAEEIPFTLSHVWHWAMRCEAAGISDYSSAAQRNRSSTAGRAHICM